MFLSDQPATSLGGCATLWRGSVLRLHFILPVDAFSHLPGLKILGLNLHDSQLLPGVLWSLGSCSCSFSLATTWITTSYPLMLDNWSSLWYLVSSSPCLDGNLDVWLPLSLWWLAIKYSCLQNVGGLADIFPDLVFGPWTCWTCHSTTG